MNMFLNSMESKEISTFRRISNTLQHLSTYHLSLPVEDGTENEHPLRSPDIDMLKHLLDGDFKRDRTQIRQLIQNSKSFEEIHLIESISPEVHRERTIQAVREVIDLSIVSVTDMKDNPEKFLSWFETVSICDLSVVLKFAVQYNLWGGTVLFLGTKKHHDKYLNDISNGKLLGVFGLTELGHGSNVQGLETTSTYDNATGEFIINSPTWTSQKYWPGNISAHGQMATVFARLIVDGTDHGVHAFIVPIRSAPSPGKPYGEVLPGVEIRDITQKSAYNGIDNGGLLFRNVRIPKDNMLDRFSCVNERGQYQSTVPPNRHFAAMMSVFFIGRLCISSISLTAMKSGLVVALSYSHNRKQFGPPKQPEQPIINYSTHQRRLIPWIARCYTLDFTHKYVVKSSKSMDVLHSYSSGLKAVTSWDSLVALQNARECMGGQGMRLKSRITVLRAHSDMCTTGEGDNIVLCQQVAKFLLFKYNNSINEGGSFTGELEYVNNIHRPTTENWRSLSYQQWLLEKREFALIKELHKKMYTSNPSIKPNSEEWYHLWDKCLNLAIQLTKANVDRLVHSIFLQKIISITKESNASTLQMLKKLCCLDGLVQIQRDLGFFCSTGIISGHDKWVKLDDEINALCKEITPFSRELVEPFGIPPRFHPYQNSLE
ncbi:acyl-CoA oxidase [Heterostelium album PN500]|uniref:Acyl-coenzyme A oxidase n=1 Tax=Heterostelium pallidum (strain ATCC 26659 / Pp 5 / PN500) TaxID=670386 RepID=D3BI30_HETP5|nr:acyl-CoA oxidase [Heterostelium album PN500]EFA78930.1 acyl-CoA oxidase [Heterostelium album PN500]|eukprot:XP_020431054.1 acyl-CoA oxidase [Heterostelium album PN500]